MEYLYKQRYLKAFDALPHADQQRVVDSLRQIKQYLRTGHAPYGLRIQPLYDSIRSRVFEARISLALRIVWTREGERVTFVLLGTHDEVRRFLRSW